MAKDRAETRVSESNDFFVTIKGLNEVNWIETYPNKEFTKNVYPGLDLTSQKRDQVTEITFSLSPSTRNEPIFLS